MLYIEPRGGLCNRMRSISSVLFLSKKYMAAIGARFQMSQQR